MTALLTADARRAFQQGRYHTARNAYRSIGAQVGEQLFNANIELCNRRERQEALTLKPEEEQPWITYCVPCYRRQNDLEQNLSENLRVLAQFPRVRLMLNLFDTDDVSYRWVSRHFRTEVESGLLQVNREPALTSWHAPIAKNSFAKYLSDEGYYSALDSDNRLTHSDVIRTRQAISEFGPCIIHHFQGSWGDGTCGRLTMPAKAYRENLCTDYLLPRQSEEIALLINVINAHPSWPLITRYHTNVLQKSHNLKQMALLNRWKVQVIPCDLGDAPIPSDAKIEGYAQKDPKLAFYTKINGCYVCMLACSEDPARDEFLSRLNRAKHELANSSTLASMVSEIVEPYEGQTMREDDRRRPQIVVIQSWDARMGEWLKKQRARGVRRFFMVNATGDDNLLRRLNEPDVTLFKPLVGDVNTFKDLWIAALTHKYGSAGHSHGFEARYDHVSAM